MGLLCFWTLSIVMFFYLKHNFSKTGYCLRLQVDRDRMQSLKYVLKKNRMMDNV
jgi:hypothetical protein